MVLYIGERQQEEAAAQNLYKILKRFGESDEDNIF